MPTSATFDRAINHCDANGNVIKTAPTDTAGAAQGSPREIRYDASNRPRYIRDPAAPGSPSALFTYTPDGRRVYEVLSERDGRYHRPLSRSALKQRAPDALRLNDFR